MKNKNSFNEPIVRFAPSPTGALHLGGARVALFNYLFAKKYGGEFLVRIEDTDIIRSKEKYTNQICESLKWLGLNWDKEIIIQSKNNLRHKSIIEKLLLNGKAYKCFASKEELEYIRKETKSYRYPGIWRDRSNEDINKEEKNGTPFSVRLKIPLTGNTTFKDKVYGNISVKNSEIDDFILARSDSNNTPVYNLVVVVDDHDMNITHVIRGEDHISNTVKQILIIQALDWGIPKYAHLPMILGPNGQRLSKRHSATGVQSYQKMGYQAEGLLNYLAFLGWNPATEEEIMNLDRLIQQFDLDNVQKKGAIFDEKKLNWISGQHLSMQTAQYIFENIKKINPKWGKSDDEYNLSVINLFKDRSTSLVQLMESSSYFFEDIVRYDLNIKEKFWKNDTIDIVESYKTSIIKIDNWNSNKIEKVTKNYMGEYDIGFGKLMKPVRFILCGAINGPPLFDIIELLGKEIFIRRIENAFKEFN